MSESEALANETIDEISEIPIFTKNKEQKQPIFEESMESEKKENHETSTTTKPGANKNIVEKEKSNAPKGKLTSPNKK